MNPQTLEQSKLTTELSPWNKNENVIWLASTLAFHRNIDKYKFPQKLELDRKRQIVNLLSKPLLASDKLQNPVMVLSEEITALDKNFLQEHFLIFDGFQESRKGEAFIVDDSGQFMALLNVKDHVILHLTDVAGDLEKSFSKLTAFENTLTGSSNFAFSQKFGFLTVDPQIAGTALVVTAYLHIPALIHQNKLTELIEKDKSGNLLYAGLQGTPQDFIGDILAIRNNFTLGVNEETILTTLRNGILKIVVAEKDARSKIKKSDSATFTLFEDKISRALGILKFSFQLETLEALSTLSLMKLGAELGFVKGITVQEINKLLFVCRRAHLNYFLKEKIPNEQVAIKRGQLLRDKMQSVNCDFT